MKALIGHTGYVGETLKRQQLFDCMYRSSDFAGYEQKRFELVVCAAAPAKKWIANRAPAEDLANIEGLIKKLDQLNCDRFILVSTVDVFVDPRGVDERSNVDLAGHHAYGRHRRLLEEFVSERFGNHLIVRLPGLVGPGLRKNVIFDFLNNNDVDGIDSRWRFQFYPMVNLWSDMQQALDAGLSLVHLTAEPITVGEVARQGFNRNFDRILDKPLANYDMRTAYAEVFGGHGAYQYSLRESVQAIRAYAQSEPQTMPVPPGAAQ